jgi:hypothetical protein
MKFQRLLVLIVPALVLHCAKPEGFGGKKDPEASEEVANLTADDIEFNWGTPNFVKKGLLTQIQVTAFESVAGYWGAFCFENNNPCERASSEIREVIKNNPVGIQGFKLNIYQPAGTVVNITAASVTTAWPKISKADGRLSFEERHTRNLVGTACSTSDANAVGLDAGTAGSEQIMTSLYLFDRGDRSTETGAYSNASMHAARVWYSGFVPYPSISEQEKFLFQYLPSAAAATKDFGVEQYSEGSSGVVTTELFGLDSAYATTVNNDADTTNNVPNWASHMVVGFCISGTKVIGSGASALTRPVFLGSKVRTYRPEMRVILAK